MRHFVSNSSFRPYLISRNFFGHTVYVFLKLNVFVCILFSRIDTGMEGEHEDCTTDEFLKEVKDRAKVDNTIITWEKLNELYR